VMLELGERVGIRPEFYMVVNLYFDLKEPFRLDPAKKYSWEEIADTIYKSYFGPEHGLEWFKKHGVLKWPKKPEEPYWKPFIKARVPIYFEWIKGLGEKIKKIAEEQDLKDIDTSDFQPLPDWKPCSALEYQGNEYDLQAIYYRVPWHTFSMTYENPWLDEISDNEPYSYFISINTDTAKKKGIKDGDLIWVESLDAGKTKGRARLVEGIHPEVIGVANNGGHWSPNMPVAKDKGVFFEALLPLSLDKTDLVTITMDCDARVKIYKVEG